MLKSWSFKCSNQFLQCGSNHLKMWSLRTLGNLRWSVLCSRMSRTHIGSERLQPSLYLRSLHSTSPTETSKHNLQTIQYIIQHPHIFGASSSVCYLARQHTYTCTRTRTHAMNTRTTHSKCFWQVFFHLVDCEAHSCIALGLILESRRAVVQHRMMLPLIREGHNYFISVLQKKKILNARLKLWNVLRHLRGQQRGRNTFASSQSTAYLRHVLLSSLSAASVNFLLWQATHMMSVIRSFRHLLRMMFVSPTPTMQPKMYTNVIFKKLHMFVHSAVPWIRNGSNRTNIEIQRESWTNTQWFMQLPNMLMCFAADSEGGGGGKIFYGCWCDK